MKQELKKILQLAKNWIFKYYNFIFVILLFMASIIKVIYYVGMADNPYKFEMAFFYGLKSVGPRIILLLLTYVMLFSFGFLFKNFLRYIYFSLIYVATLIFVYMDLKYSRFFQGPPSLFWTIMPHNPNNDVSMSYWVHYAKTDFLFFVDTFIFVILFTLGFVFKRFKKDNIKFKLKLTTCISSVIIFTIVSLAIPSETLNPQNTTKKVASYGNMIYHIMDVMQVYDYDWNISMSKSDKKLYKKYESLLEEDESNSTDLYDLGNKLNDTNLVVLQLEAVESFVIGNEIGGMEITPFLNSLLGNSVQMNVYEQVRTGNSSDCDLMFMTSQYPVSRVITFNQFAKSEYLSLADVLKSKGYKTAYLNGAYGSTWNYKGVMDTTLGFDNVEFGDSLLEDDAEISDYDDVINLNRVCGYIPDRQMLKYAYEKMIKPISSQKFYSHTVLCSTHIPWVLPDSIDKLFLNNNKKIKNEIGSYMYNYLSLCHYVDTCISEFVGQLEADGLMDNTTLVVMGDHGGIHKYMSNRTKKLTESKEEYKWMTKASTYTALTLIYNKNLINDYYVIGDNCNTYNYNIMSLRPSLKNHIDKKCGQVDILPTLSYMYGIKDDFKCDGVSTLMGRNMLKTNLSYAILANEKVLGCIPSHYQKLRNAQYISNALIKSEYYNKYDNVRIN